MAERLRGLGLPGVTARTFHAHALSQLRFFWPLHHDGAPLPELLDSKLPLLGRIARRLPGHYRFTPAKDLADEIEWAKSRRIGPGDYEQAAATAVARAADPGRPVRAGLRRLRAFEGPRRADRLRRPPDRDDRPPLDAMPRRRPPIRARKRWFSVDEFQDTSPLQERLLALWAAESRDVCVVGDADQTIYTFAGASPAYLETFADVHPGSRVVELTENYRSTPEVLDLANRLLWSAGRPKRLSATRPAGPAPTITRHADGRCGARLARRAGPELLVADGTPPSEIAVLVRTNAQLEPVESALTRAGVAFRVRGVAFFKRPDVRAAIDLVRRSTDGGVARRASRCGPPSGRRGRRELGFEDDAEERGNEARERAAAMATLAGILDDLVGASASLARDDLLADVRPAGRRRAGGAGAGGGGGVELVDVPPGEGPRVGRGVPADARGRLAADPAGVRRRRGARGGAAAALRRDHAGPRPPRPVVGRAARAERRRRRRAGASPAIRVLAAGIAVDARRRGGGRLRVRAGPRERSARSRDRTPDSPAMAHFASGAGGEARTTTCRRSSSPTMRRSGRSRRPARRSLAALGRVKGMGPTKLERYGAEILAAIASRHDGPGRCRGLIEVTIECSPSPRAVRGVEDGLRVLAVELRAVHVRRSRCSRTSSAS